MIKNGKVKEAEEIEEIDFAEAIKKTVKNYGKTDHTGRDRWLREEHPSSDDKRISGEPGKESRSK